MAVLRVQLNVHAPSCVSSPREWLQTVRGYVKASQCMGVSVHGGLSAWGSQCMGMPVCRDQVLPHFKDWNLLNAVALIQLGNGHYRS